MNKNKTLSKRRDRRLAKQSDFKRPGRSNSKKIGHGGSGQILTKKQSNRSSRGFVYPETKDTFRVPLEEVVRVK